MYDFRDILEKDKKNLNFSEITEDEVKNIVEQHVSGDSSSIYVLIGYSFSFSKDFIGHYISEGVPYGDCYDNFILSFFDVIKDYSRITSDKEVAGKYSFRDILKWYYDSRMMAWVLNMKKTAPEISLILYNKNVETREF